MSRRSTLMLVLIVLVFAVALLMLDPARDRPTVRSPLPEGYRAAFRYLEERGFSAEAWQRPLTELGDENATLVVAGPFSRGVSAREREALEAWMSGGGTLVFLPSGRALDPGERMLHLELGLASERLEDAEPLEWEAWRRWKSERQGFRRASATRWPGAPEIIRSLRARERINQPGGARTLYVDPDGAPVVFEIPRGEGRLIVINDASVLSNALIGESGNLALLELIAREALGAGQSLLFDEWRHGYADPDTESAATAGAFELLVLHLLVLYLATLWALGRRFGPRLVEPRLLRGSVARDLHAIAALHQRSGHAKEAGALLLSRARKMGRGRPALAELPESFDGDEKALDALARRIATLQEEGRL